jgi:acyl-CoA synthetase (AMP-forming)/AMP-acid ligase II
VEFQLADLFESIADRVPDREAMVAGDRRLTYAQLETRANQLANQLSALGVGVGDHVGIQLHNGTEYIEAMLASFKLRAVPINVNYRYMEEELHYLFDDADLVALIVHKSFIPHVASVASSLPKLKDFIVVDEVCEVELTLPRALDYETALAASSDKRIGGPRSSEDLYVVYTGGTTGMPKGVMWHHEDIFFAAMGGGDILRTGNPVRKPEELAERIPEQTLGALPAPPFMHAAAQWLAFTTLFSGGKIVIPEGGGFNPDEIWDLIAREKLLMLVIVGDAMATPLADSLEANPDRFDLSSLIVIASGGALFSPSTKERLRMQLPNRIIMDGLGSSETGVMGNKASMPGVALDKEPCFIVNEQISVLDENLKPVVRGSGAIGHLARKGCVPIGYYNDTQKSRNTFLVVDGERWALPGDMATVEIDGTVRLLGRDKFSINTGGEKVFPEEVEAVIKAHPNVFDVLVVGLPDENWGEKIVAVVQVRPGANLTLEQVRDFCSTHISHFKEPRELVLADTICRSPTGKADYGWAKAHAIQGLGA